MKGTLKDASETREERSLKLGSDNGCWCGGQRSGSYGGMRRSEVSKEENSGQRSSDVPTVEGDVADRKGEQYRRLRDRLQRERGSTLLPERMEVEAGTLWDGRVSGGEVRGGKPPHMT